MLNTVKHFNVGNLEVRIHVKILGLIKVARYRDHSVTVTSLTVHFRHSAADSKNLGINSNFFDPAHIYMYPIQG